MPGPTDRIPIGSSPEIADVRRELAALRKEAAEVRASFSEIRSALPHLRYALAYAGVPALPAVPSRLIGLGLPVAATSATFSLIRRAIEESAREARERAAAETLTVRLLSEIRGVPGLAALTAVRAQRMAAEERVRRAAPELLAPWRAGDIARAGRLAAEAAAASERAARLYGAPRIGMEAAQEAPEVQYALEGELNPALQLLGRIAPLRRLGQWFAQNVWDPYAARRDELAAQYVRSRAQAAERARQDVIAQWRSRAANLAAERDALWTLRAARDAALRERWDWSDK